MGKTNGICYVTGYEVGSGYEVVERSLSSSGPSLTETALQQSPSATPPPAPCPMQRTPPKHPATEGRRTLRYHFLRALQSRAMLRACSPRGCRCSCPSPPFTQTNCICVYTRCCLQIRSALCTTTATPTAEYPLVQLFHTLNP